MKLILYILGGIAAIALIVVMSIGIWHLHWFVARANADAAGQVAQHNYSRQIGVAGQIDTDTKTVVGIDAQIAGADPEQATALRAQRTAIVGSICDAAANLNDTAQVSTSAQALIAKECK